MFKVLVSAMFAVLFVGGSVRAETLKLGSDAKSIKEKSRTIEIEYSRNMRDGGHEGALNVEEKPAPALRSIPGATNTYYSEANGITYNSTLKMREKRKVGAGVSVGGSLGLAGVNVEFNFEDADGVLAGFGTGPGYHSVQIAWKHVFEGDYIAPYTTVGYSRWYNSRGRSDDYNQSDILDRVLTAAEKKEGRFGTDFVNGSLGLQYNQLSGDFAGVSVYGELMGMYEVKRAMLLPNGSVGAIYYF